MGNIKRFLMIGICLMLFGVYSDANAGQNITILDHTIKAVATVSSGRFIKIAWQVKLKNENDKPMNCVITVAFLDENKENLGTATKKSTIDGSEAKTIADTVVLRTDIAQRIKVGEVAVDLDMG